MQQNNTPPNTSPAEIVSAIKANDEKVINKLYLDNYGKISQYVLNNNGSSEEAADIYQEAFIAVWRNIQADKFQPDNDSSLSGYLFQVAKYKWLDQLRKMKRNKVISIDDDKSFLPIENDYSSEETDYLELVKKHFSSLGEQCRQLLDMFYYKKESLRNIAGFFSWTEASAKNNKYRCLQRLREMVIKKI